mmetsp:Transcript_16128/g.41806  ORF Transcript_16128/g.41806 Transcript_16128/m.41806 type:complete len:247 (+) Transcript_16128:170-910(+)
MGVPVYCGSDPATLSRLRSTGEGVVTGGADSVRGGESDVEHPKTLFRGLQSFRTLFCCVCHVPNSLRTQQPGATLLGVVTIPDVPNSPQPCCVSLDSPVRCVRRSSPPLPARWPVPRPAAWWPSHREAPLHRTLLLLRRRFLSCPDTRFGHSGHRPPLRGMAVDFRYGAGQTAKTWKTRSTRTSRGAPLPVSSAHASRQTRPILIPTSMSAWKTTAFTRSHQNSQAPIGRGPLSPQTPSTKTRSIR